VKAAEGRNAGEASGADDWKEGTEEMGRLYNQKNTEDTWIVTRRSSSLW